jgi:deoxyribodipyrimidine photo-lyase
VKEFLPTTFEPTLPAAHARLDAVQPEAYARTRNALDGAVTRLSPYLTHGLLSLREVHADVHARAPLDAKHKFVFELGWRAYYRHVWAHLGHGIHQSLHTGLLPEEAYQTEMPADVLEARTGVAAIDLAVRELYATGYLHNHARMWLASYLVHLRRVHWYVGAQWMLAHLLDGDVASNHLSWQWVAGTGSSKPYLFNADNVAKYAPEPWHSPGTVIDSSYEALDRIARSTKAVNPRLDNRRAGLGLQPPEVVVAPPGDWWQAPAPTTVVGRDVWLLHPWSLGAVPQGMGADAVVLGIGFAESHAQMPWSMGRWNFVTKGLLARTPHLWWGSVAEIAQALQGARSLGWQSDAHADGALEGLRTQLMVRQAQPLLTTVEEPPLFENVEPYCDSFSQWWRKTRIAQ